MARAKYFKIDIIFLILKKLIEINKFKLCDKQLEFEV